MNVVNKMLVLIVSVVLGTVGGIAGGAAASAGRVQTDALDSAMDRAGITAEALGSCSQILLVESAGTRATIYFYEKNDTGSFTCNDSMTSSGWVGKGGVGTASEYKPVTPFGLYPIEEAFYTGNKPDTGLSTFRITPDTYWVDDPSSKYYNQRVVGTADRDWDSAEEMYISPYRYGFVIGYNRVNTVPGAGSAFFFHIYAQPTDGCVGTNEAAVLSILSKLDASKNPRILIV